MKVYKLVRSCGYTKNILDHFSFTIWDNETQHMISVSKPTADDYIQLAGRNVLEWSPWGDYTPIDDKYDGIDITVSMEHWDRDTFKE